MSKIGWTLGAAAALGAVAGYAHWIEPRWLEVRTPRVHLRGLPAAFEGLRVGLLTDLHVRAPRDLRTLARAVDRVVEARPDLVALTGDFVEARSRQRLGEVLTVLDRLDAPLGVYAVPGNHDHKAGIERWHRAVGRHPRIEDLTNRSVMRDPGGARLCVAGVDDLYEGEPRLLLPPRETRDLTLLLAHSPDQAERCRRRCDSVDLILSGHTHGGQVRIPLLDVPVISGHHGEMYDQGLRRRPWTQVYTSRGVGTARLPVRLLARPEVTILELTGAPRPPR